MFTFKIRKMAYSTDQSSQSNQKSYISCLKINGVPILPPLLTPDYRQEMHYYKQLALAVEQRVFDLKMCQDETTMNSNILRSDSEEWCDGINISSVSLKSDHEIHNYPKSTCPNINKIDYIENNDFESMNSQVTVIDNENEISPKVSKNSIELYTGNELMKKDTAIIHAHNYLSSSTPKVEKKETPIQSMSAKPFIKYNDNNYYNNTVFNDKDMNIICGQKMNLERDKRIVKDIQVLRMNSSSPKKDSKTISNQFKNKKIASSKKENISSLKNKIASTRKSNGHPKSVNETPIHKSKYVDTKIKGKLSPSKNVTGSLNNISSGLISPPKLVRQNSYTLENPSPLLLAHLEERSLASGVDLNSISMSESTSTSFLCNTSKQKSWDSNTAKETWSSIGSDINSINEYSENNVSIQEKSPIKDLVVSNVSKIVSPCIIKEKCIEINKKSVDKNVAIPSETSPSPYEFKSLSINKDKQAAQLDDKVLDEACKVNNISISSDAILDNEPLSPTEVMKSKSMTNDDFNNILKKIKEEHEKKLAYLIKKQQEEQEKKLAYLIEKQQEEQLLLKKAFEDQQKLLLKQFETVMCQEKPDEKVVVHPPEIINITHHKKVEYSSEKQTKSEYFVDKPDSVKYSKYIEDDTDKHLIISADALNKSRNLLNNYHILNSSSDSRKSPSILSENGNMVNKEFSPKQKVKYYKKDRDNVPVNIFDVNSDVSITDLSSISLKNHENEHAVEIIASSRTSNTLDDVNSIFTSDDGLLFDNKTNYDSLSPGFDKKDAKSLRLKSAYDKISEIQKSLATQQFTVERCEKPLSPEMSVVDNFQNISLSSISNRTSLSFDSDNQNTIFNKNALSLNLTDICKPNDPNHQQRRKDFFFKHQYQENEIEAANTIVAYAKGYLTRRLKKTEKVESIVQTIKDTLLCALQLHRDESGIQGADIGLHRRLIQQITAACYTLHDIFIIYTPAERMSIIAQDRERKISLLHKKPSSTSSIKQLSTTTQKFLRRKLERMSNSHTGVFSHRTIRSINSIPQQMTKSHHEHNGHMRSGLHEKARRSVAVVNEFTSRKPWR